MAEPMNKPFTNPFSQIAEFFQRKIVDSRIADLEEKCTRLENKLKEEESIAKKMERDANDMEHEYMEFFLLEEYCELFPQLFDSFDQKYKFSSETVAKIEKRSNEQDTRFIQKLEEKQRQNEERIGHLNDKRKLLKFKIKAPYQNTRSKGSAAKGNSSSDESAEIHISTPRTPRPLQTPRGVQALQLPTPHENLPLLSFAEDFIKKAIFEIRAAAEDRAYQNDFLFKNIFFACRRRRAQICLLDEKSENYSENIARLLFAFYKEDLGPLREELKRKPAEWTYWGGKTAKALERIEEEFEAQSREYPELAEEFYRDTYENLDKELRAKIVKFTTLKIAVENSNIQAEYTRKKLPIGEQKPLDISDAAEKMLDTLNAIRSNHTSQLSANSKGKEEAYQLRYQEKLILCCDALLELKENIIQIHGEKYQDYVNLPIEREEGIYEKAGLPRPNFPGKIQKEKAIQEAFKANFNPRERKQAERLARKLSIFTHKKIDELAPNSIQAPHREVVILEKIGNLCHSYFEKHASSRWFKIIEGAHSSAKLGEWKTMNPHKRLALVLEAFQNAEIQILNSSLKEDREDRWRSMLVNSHSLQLIHRIIETIQENILTNRQNWSDIESTDMNKRIDQIEEKRREINSKFYFFGLAKPKLNFKIASSGPKRNP